LQKKISEKALQLINRKGMKKEIARYLDIDLCNVYRNAHKNQKHGILTTYGVLLLLSKHGFCAIDDLIIKN